MAIQTRHEPTADQLLAMAYVDGELSESSRREFEDLLERDPALKRDVSELKALDLLLTHVRSANPNRLGHERLRRVMSRAQHLNIDAT